MNDWTDWAIAAVATIVIGLIGFMLVDDWMSSSTEALATVESKHVVAGWVETQNMQVGDTNIPLITYHPEEYHILLSGDGRTGDIEVDLETYFKTVEGRQAFVRFHIGKWSRTVTGVTIIRWDPTPEEKP